LVSGLKKESRKRSKKRGTKTRARGSTNPEGVGKFLGLNLEKGKTKKETKSSRLSNKLNGRQGRDGEGEILAAEGSITMSYISGGCPLGDGVLVQGCLVGSEAQTMIIKDRRVGRERYPQEKIVEEESM